MKLYHVALFLVLLSSCKDNPEKKEEENTGTASENVNPVKVEVLKPSAFKKELVSNGKLASLKKSSIALKVSGRITEIKTNNGEFVKKGGIIAQLENTPYQRAYQQAKINLEKAELELESRLIGLGWELADSVNVPAKILNVAKTRSGYSSALLDMEKANYDLENTVLRAPFAGIAANIKHKEYEQVNAGEVFCLLIDNSMFEVEFRVLETEVGMLQIGKKVTVVPYILKNERFTGEIREINPVIDQYGMVSVKAGIQGATKLMEGMNVNIFVETEIPGQLVVPRKAVLLRDNYHVLFKYQNGIAYWTYLEVVDENSYSYSVIAHREKNANLEAGDTIIVEGNMYLAHDSEVEIRNEGMKE